MQQGGDDPALIAALAFLDAFRNLDWAAFRLSFAEDATFFFPPTAGAPRRADGRAAIEAVFRRVFAAARRRKNAPPYLTIEPKDVRVQAFRDAALVTFHLEDDDAFGRRTILLENRAGQWLIVHVHASNLPAPE